jgi:hypothetical protein
MVALDTAEKQVQEYRATLDDMEERLSKSGMLFFFRMCTFLSSICYIRWSRYIYVSLEACTEFGPTFFLVVFSLICRAQKVGRTRSIESDSLL